MLNSRLGFFIEKSELNRLKHCFSESLSRISIRFQLFGNRVNDVSLEWDPEQEALDKFPEIGICRVSYMTDTISSSFFGKVSELEVRVHEC